MVEDEPTIAIALQDDLEEEGYRVEAVMTALEKTRGGFDLVLLDVMLPGKEGFTVLREMRKGRFFPARTCAGVISPMNASASAISCMTVA